MIAPDFELVVAGYLAERLDARVGTRTPRETSAAWVRVWLLDAAPVTGSPVFYLHNAVLQIDCYAGEDRDTGHAAASLLARTALAELERLPGQTRAGAVISKVTPESGMRRLPDEDFEPARERFSFDITVTAHPAPA